MRELIKPEDIREGDLIRAERVGIEGRAHEFYAQIKGDTDGYAPGHFNWFLLDRPTPAVDLPKDDTLGWLTSTGNCAVLATWKPEQLTGGPGMSPARHGFRALLPEITAFVPAVAVPANALDALRSGIINDFDEAVRLIDTFLSLVDAANGDPR